MPESRSANGGPDLAETGGGYQRLPDYDATRRADPHLCAALAAQLELAPGRHYLDVGCGTGNYTLALAALNGQWHGLDASENMLAHARRKDVESRVIWQVGSAETRPPAKGRMHGMLVQLVLHHLTDLAAALSNLAEALRPGGVVLIFTVLPEQARAHWLADYFPSMVARDARALPSLADLDAALPAALTPHAPQAYFVPPDSQDHYFYSGTQRPEIYLDARMRQNMSPFRLCAAPEELQSGLARLAADISSGAMRTRMARRHRLGEYCFIKLTKKPV